MIRNFADHSANERTFLAWVRTAIAVMAFGFIVEKFDLFLEVAAPSLVGRPLSLPGHRFGNIAGLALIALGIAMVAVTVARFLITARNIDSEEQRPGLAHRYRARCPARQRLIRLSLARPGHKAVTPAARRVARAQIAHFASCRRMDNNSCRRSVLVFG
jgi:putative membrane protein